MSEIEFDEIDKAVSSALGGGVSENSSGESVAVSRGKSSSEIHVRSTGTKTLVRGPLSARHPGGGRFMDVVTPSSTMKSGSKSVEVNAKPAYAFPTGEVADSSLEDTLDPNLSETGEPMASPFLSDAKVEKRPLGAFSEMGQSEETPEENIDTPLPAELNKDILNLESNQTLPETPVSGETDETAETEQVTEDAPIEEVSTPEPQKDEEIVPPVPSIIQQYQEKPSSASTESGAIFDTEQYHAPIAPVTKKKSGWMIVIWILALVIFGAGLGAAAYYFVLPNFL